MDISLAAPCGIYCGMCRAYLVKKKDQLQQRGYKQGCDGCRIRFKKCAFIRRDCQSLLKKEIDFCSECVKFPCDNLKKINRTYTERYAVNLIENLKRIKIVGVDKWLQEQKELYTCPECGGEMCIHDEKCYDCGKKSNPNKK